VATVLAEKPLRLTLQEEIKEKLPEQNVSVMLDLFDLEPDAGHDQTLNISLKLHQLENY